MSETRIVSWYSALWLSRSLKTPAAWSSRSGMIAFSIPMQPSSKTPISAFFRTRSVAMPAASFSTALGTRTDSAGTTWLVSWCTAPESSQAARCRPNEGLAKSSAQSVA